MSLPGIRRYFSLPEAADHMRLSQETLETAIRAKKLRAKKTGPNGGGKYLIAGDDLDAWFESLVDG